MRQANGNNLTTKFMSELEYTFRAEANARNFGKGIHFLFIIAMPSHAFAAIVVKVKQYRVKRLCRG
jgi:hypothetical protein